MVIFRSTSRGAGGDFVRPAPRILAVIGIGAFAALLITGARPAEARHHLRYHAHVRHGSFGIDPGREAESVVIDADTGATAGGS